MEDINTSQVIWIIAVVLIIRLSICLTFLLAAYKGYLWLSAKNRPPQVSMVRTTFFNGHVLAEYFRTDQTNHDDYLTLTFYKPGTYGLAFSLTPSKPVRFGRGESTLPKDVELTVEDTPQVHIIRQRSMPDYLQIAIIRDTASEDYDFA